MKFSLMFAMLLFSCASAHRIVPREVSRASAEARERTELTESLEREVEESNRLRGELAEFSSKAETVKDVEKPAREEEYTPRLIVFTAIEWCQPCRTFDKEIAKLGAMAYQDSKGVDHLWSEKIGEGPKNAIQIIDISDESDTVSGEMAVKYLIEAVPTIIRIDADGKQESRFSGVLNAETLCRYQAGTWKPPPAKKKKNIVFMMD